MPKPKSKTPRKRNLPEGLTRALAQRKPGVDSEALLRDVIEIWGGTRRLAADIHEEYQNAPKGGVVRSRIIEMLQRLIISNTSLDLGRSAPASDLSDDELQAVAERYIKKVIPDGPQAAAPAPAE